LHSGKSGLNAESTAILAAKTSPLVTTQTPVQAQEPPIPLITQLFACVTTKDPDYLLYFGTKWLVGAISAIHGEHSPLMLVLSGEIQNTGKTEYFRRLLPADLMSYYAESKLDAGKDDEILMTQKLLIVDDEMGGKSKKEVKRLKELTSKQTFSLREPYGRNNVDLNRLAVLGGTTNDNEILSDPTGNRRIIPIHVAAINHEQYNAIDKVALWMEVYELWKSGFKWKLSRADIQYLAKDSNEFEMSNSEAELIQKYFEPGATQLTATEVKVFIESKTLQKLSLDRLGKELKRLGFEQKHAKVGAGTKRVYLVSYVNNPNTNEALPLNSKPDDDLPF
jgi:predicted P-loop ATPase